MGPCPSPLITHSSLLTHRAPSGLVIPFVFLLHPGCRYPLSRLRGQRPDVAVFLVDFVDGIGHGSNRRNGGHGVGHEWMGDLATHLVHLSVSGELRGIEVGRCGSWVPHSVMDHNHHHHHHHCQGLPHPPVCLTCCTCTHMLARRRRPRHQDVVSLGRRPPAPAARAAGDGVGLLVDGSFALTGAPMEAIVQLPQLLG